MISCCSNSSAVDGVDDFYLPNTKEVEEDEVYHAEMQKMHQARMERVIHQASQPNKAEPKESTLKERIQQPQNTGVLAAVSESDAILFPLPENTNMQRNLNDRREYPLEDSFVASSQSPAFRAPLVISEPTGGRFVFVNRPVDPNSAKGLYFDEETVRVPETQKKIFFPTTTKVAIEQANVDCAAAEARGDNDSFPNRLGKAIVTKGVPQAAMRVEQILKLLN